MEICDGWKERILFMLFLYDKRKETLAKIQIVFELSWGIFMLLSWRLFFLKGFLVNWHQFKILNRHISLHIYISIYGVCYELSESVWLMTMICDLRSWKPRVCGTVSNSYFLKTLTRERITLRCCLRIVTNKISIMSLFLSNHPVNSASQ
jgi:hypothetical protein